MALATDKLQFYFDVAVNKPLYHLFTYQFSRPISNGTRVTIPFGSQKMLGIIVRENKNPAIASHKIKSIEAVLDNEPLFSEEWLSLIQFTATYYLYPIGQTFFTALPPDLKKNKPVSHPQATLLYKFNENIYQQKRPHKRHLSLIALWNALEHSYISEEEAVYIHPNAKTYLKNFQKKHLLQTKSIESSLQLRYCAKVLNHEQQIACHTISSDLNQFKIYLLFGITGSGKTEVYFEIMHHVLKNKKQVLMLLPVINLTPQFFCRIKETFPESSVVLLHSKISNRTRLENYLNANSGKAHIIIGTRLAVFTPIKKLGLIVVDEENDDSFKQENDLRYHARDLAIWRAQNNHCPIILGSATPSLESWYQATQQNYHLLRLTQKALSQIQQPEIKLIPIKNQKLNSGFSQELLDSIHQNLIHKQISLIYLNRRGYAPALVCFDCGYIIQCDDCSAKMVFHKQQNKLKCHHCEQEKLPPAACPKCGNQDLITLGIGTEKLEFFLHEYFPTARIARVDSDTISNKNAWDKIYESVINDEIDIIIGTQILAKGHDFKNLSLVAIIDPDNSLFSADYRAPEKLFSELMQVSGRTGRASKPGKILIQTRFPEHELFQALKAHHYEDFANQQLKERLLLKFPPLTHRIVIKAEHPNFQMAESFLLDLKATIPHHNIHLNGPLPMNMFKLAKRERALLYFESENRIQLHQTVKQSIGVLLSLQKKYKNLKWAVDVDPYEL